MASSQILMKILPNLRASVPILLVLFLVSPLDSPEPAVDGNVMRVMARLFEVNYDIGDAKNRKIFQAIMEILIDPDRPGDFNQALMDLGTDIESAKIRDQTKVQFAFSVQPILTELMTSTLSNCLRKSLNLCKFRLLLSKMKRENFCSKKKCRGTPTRWSLVLPYHGNGLYWSTT